MIWSMMACAVDEVTELGFPDDEVARVGRGVAPFVREHGFFAEHAVVDEQLALLLIEVRQRGEGVAGVVIVVDGVAVAEGATLHVLPGEADARAFQQQRAHRQHFGAAPVDAFSVLHHVTAGADDALFELRVEGEAVRRLVVRGDDLVENWLGDLRVG
ncbi:MAG: hypothetical protein QM754_05705 [Tepidisphaeraceae bacterium]